MASWSLLTALSGYSFDLPAGLLGFAPRLWQDEFRCFWSADGVWGQYEQRLTETPQISLRVDYGAITLNGLNLGALDGRVLLTARLGGRRWTLTTVEQEGILAVRWPEPITVQAGETLILE